MCAKYCEKKSEIFDKFVRMECAKYFSPILLQHWWWSPGPADKSLNAKPFIQLFLSSNFYFQLFLPQLKFLTIQVLLIIVTQRKTLYLTFSCFYFFIQCWNILILLNLSHSKQNMSCNLFFYLLFSFNFTLLKKRTNIDIFCLP